jgi:hypothetical protein
VARLLLRISQIDAGWDVMRARLISSTTLQPVAEEAIVTPRNASLLGISAALACVLGLPGIARADFIPPAGVTDYRLIFVTAGSISATSSAIADYNSFATSQAALNPDLPSTTWTAVVSTDSLDAVGNIACKPGCANVPIFLVDGTEVAASTNALFNAATVSLLNNGISEDQNGNSISGYVWSGSFSDGTQAISTIDSELFDNTLGGSNTAEVGFAGATDGNAIDGGQFGSREPAFPIYAISGVISPVPEPVTASLLAFGGIMTGLVGRFRRKRATRG